MGHSASLLRELSAEGIRYTIADDQSICVSRDRSLDAERVHIRVDAYRRSVAEIVLSPEHRIRVVEALQAAGKEFSVSPTDDGRAFVVVFSESEADALENRALLESLK